MRYWSCLCLGLLLALGGSMASATPLEHHLYLHVVSPAEGEQVRIIISEDDLLPSETATSAALDGAVADAGLPVAEEVEVLDVIQPAASADVESVADGEDVSATAPVEAAAAAPAAAGRTVPLGLLLFIFVLAIFLGVELISKVPSQLHTPLMSGSNAISGITIVGALAAAGIGMGGAFGTLLGTLAVIFATINVMGGYMVTNRMLGMFKKKDGGAQ
jgi:H+-translocating NAD(P) transhydrogenase subunit alpha